METNKNKQGGKKNSAILSGYDSLLQDYLDEWLFMALMQLSLIEIMNLCTFHWIQLASITLKDIPNKAMHLIKW